MVHLGKLKSNSKGQESEHAKEQSNPYYNDPSVAERTLFGEFATESHSNNVKEDFDNIEDKSNQNLVSGTSLFRLYDIKQLDL